MSRQPRSILNMFLLDLFVLLPSGAWLLMLGLPHLGLHVSYWHALGAHALIGSALSSVRMTVRTERDLDDAIERSNARRRYGRRPL